MTRTSQRTTKLQADHAYRLSCAVLQDLVDARACAMRIDVAAAFASDTAALDLPGLQLLENLAECWHKLRIPEVARERLGIPAAEEIVTVLRDDLAARNVSPVYATAGGLRCARNGLRRCAW